MSGKYFTMNAEVSTALNPTSFEEILRSFHDSDPLVHDPSYYKLISYLHSSKEEDLYLQSIPNILSFLENKICNPVSASTTPITLDRLTILHYCLRRFFSSATSYTYRMSRVSSIAPSIDTTRLQNNYFLQKSTTNNNSQKDLIYMNAFPTILTITEFSLLTYENLLQSYKEQNLSLDPFQPPLPSDRHPSTVVPTTRPSFQSSLTDRSSSETLTIVTPTEQNYHHQLFLFTFQCLQYLTSMKDYPFDHLNKLEIRTLLSLLFRWLLVTIDESLEYYSVLALDCLTDIITRYSHYMIASIQMIMINFDDMINSKYYPIPSNSLVYGRFTYFLSLGFEFYSKEIIKRLHHILYYATKEKNNFNTSEPLLSKIIASGHQSLIEADEQYGKEILQQYEEYQIDIQSPDWYLKHNSLYSMTSSSSFDSSNHHTSSSSPATTATSILLPTLSSMIASSQPDLTSDNTGETYFPKPLVYGCYLWKVGSRVPTVRRRWFQWTQSDEMIRYYVDETMQRCKGEISIHQIDSSSMLSVDYWFEWKMKDDRLHRGKFRLRCDHPDKYHQWMAILAKVSL
eukprot:gene1631-1726_t